MRQSAPWGPGVSDLAAGIETQLGESEFHSSLAPHRCCIMRPILNSILFIYKYLVDVGLHIKRLQPKHNMNPIFIQNYLAYQFRASLIQQHQAMLNAQLLAATEVAMKKEDYRPVHHLPLPASSRSPSSIGEQSDLSSLSDGSSPKMAKKLKQCRFCSSTFKSNTDLARHERIHTGEKPFSCTICHKQFNRKGNMEKHVTTHFKGADRATLLKAKQSEFVCDCGKGFKSRGFYLRHKKRCELRSNLNAQRHFNEDEDDIEIDVEVWVPAPLFTLCVYR